MRFGNRSFLLIPAALGLFGLASIWQSGGSYDVRKTSPNGVYSVKIEIRVEEGKNTTRGHVEAGRYQFFKGRKVIHIYEWKNPYQYEPTFREAMPVVEWVDDTVLRIGEERSDQPFYDELIVSNSTGDYLKYFDVSYGKHESFWGFDLAPGTEIRLQASPGFKQDKSSNYFLGYGGMTNAGRKFEGALERKQRTSTADGPLKFQITINRGDLR